MNELQLAIQSSLRFVRAAGSTGVLRTALFDAVRAPDGTRLSLEQQDAVWDAIVSRGWISSHLEPVWHNTRWSLTASGMSALEAM